MEDGETGTLYSLTAGLSFVYGLFFSGYLIDNSGVKPCLLLGSFLLAVSRLLIVIITEKLYLYIIFCSLVPLGMSLCKC